MSQKIFPHHQSAGTINDNQYHYNVNAQHDEEDVKVKRRREWTNFYIEELEKGTKILRPGEKEPTRTSGRKNKNEILGLVLTRFLLKKYLFGISSSYISELARGIQVNSSNGEFVLILRTDGRVIAMSDEAENHFGKSMRSLYTQFINIFECLDETDTAKLRSVLNSPTGSSPQEHRLVCTLRLPKGKRPSRENEDVKTITMVGHFFSCNASSNEGLFVARCEALVSPATKGASSSQTALLFNNDNPKTMINIILNEDMSVYDVSLNIKDILGYTKNEMKGNWLGRFLATNDAQKLEAIPEKFFQHGNPQRKAVPTSICEVFDMYTNNGDSRLTFLCQLRLRRQRRLKSVQYVVTAQLIDPILRDDCIHYVQSESDSYLKSNKVEQVNLVSSSVPKASKDTIMANSPSITMGLFTSNNTTSDNLAYQQQYSPINRSFSNEVAPVIIRDQFWDLSLFELDSAQYPIADVQCCPKEVFDDLCNTFEQGQTVECLSFDDLCLLY